MEILPVIDLLRGQVVRGIAGDRASYAPIQSSLCSDATPASVARAFAEAGFRRTYVADLDAIQEGPPDWESYQAIERAGLKLWIDAGVGTAQRAEAFLSGASTNLGNVTATLEGLIVGLESIGSEASLGELADSLGSRGVFSLDLKAGRLLTTVSAWQPLSPLQMATRAVEAGFQQLIVLDLAQVGRNEGLSVEPLCRDVTSRWPDLQLVSGGGVRDQADLERLAAAGCSAALVASALHDGRLAKEA